MTLSDSVVTQVKSTRCSDVELDSDLNWNVHVKELIRSFTQKLNLLRSLYFLPTFVRAYFYFKVILPTVTYGLVVWGSCGKSLIDVLEKIHVCAAKTVHNLDWYTPSDQVLARCNWFTINCLYEYTLLLLAHNCFYDFSPTPIKQLFKKYDCNYNRRRKLNFLLPKPKSELLCKFTCYKVISL